jgi:HAD superfamily hydrolase (TIGR01549 family)
VTALKVYRNHKPKIHLYDGAKEMLAALRQKRVRIGIITDGRPEGQRNKIKALGLDKMVDDIIVTDELGGAQFRKPCDISFRIMANKWRMNYADIVYIGDNVNKDFQAPQQLGMKSVFYKILIRLFTCYFILFFRIIYNSITYVVT